MNERQWFRCSLYAAYLQPWAVGDLRPPEEVVGADGSADLDSTGSFISRCR